MSKRPDSHYEAPFGSPQNGCCIVVESPTGNQVLLVQGERSMLVSKALFKMWTAQLHDAIVRVMNVAEAGASCSL